jgi:hypothetical protein
MLLRHVVPRERPDGMLVPLQSLSTGGATASANMRPGNGRSRGQGIDTPR